MGTQKLAIYTSLATLLMLAACTNSASAPASGISDAGAPDAAARPPDGMSAGTSITAGAADRILLVGTILTPDQVIEGEVLIEGPTITCVAPGGGCESMAGAVGATVIDTNGIISPGLIDTHNHILFDVFDGDDWKPSQLYQNHTQWTAEPRYHAMLDVKHCLANDPQGKPSWCANTPYGATAGSLRCEMDKFGELKGLVAGTTSIVGLPGTSSACVSSLARSIDGPHSGLGKDSIQTEALFPPSTAGADAVCANLASGATTAFLAHCGEGVDAKSVQELQTLSAVSSNAGCLLAPQTTITHGTAFGAAEFTTMAQKGMKLTWSPASNVALYGATTDISAALSAGVTIALAPDWSMGGSQNLLDELRFADAWDNSHFGDRLAARDLVLMTTQNAAKALALDDKLGKISAGALADIAVFAGDRANPYDAIVRATPSDVVLTIVGGIVLYGDAALQAAGPSQPGCEVIDVCGVSKFLCVATTQSTNQLDQTFVQIKAALEQGMLDADAQTPGDGWTFAPLPPLVKCP